MQTNRALIGLLCSACLGVAAASRAGTIVRGGSGTVATIQCDGQAVVINGASNTYTLLGDCPTVEVNGMSNKVGIETAGTIRVSGMTNQVVWSAALRGDRPVISNSGLNNTVRQGDVGGGRAASARSGDSGDTVTAGGGQVVAREGHSGDSVTLEHGRLTAREAHSGDSVTLEPGRVVAREGRDARTVVINDNRVVRRIRCATGADVVTINGNRCDITLEGPCARLSVQGNRNRASVLGSISSIEILGNTNTVTWNPDENPRAPQVDDVGSGNVARPSSR
jgi:hypothetical protein